MAAASVTAASINPRIIASETKSICRIQMGRPNAFAPKPSPYSACNISLRRNSRLITACAVAEAEAEADKIAVDPTSEAARRLYIGNFPRTVDDEELTKILAEHGSVQKAQVMYDKYSGRSRRFGFATMKSVEDANAVIDKLNGTQIGGREIKVNITENPISSTVDLSVLQATDDSDFADSPYKLYVGNLAKTVTSETLKTLFSDKAQAVSAKVSRVPGTSKSSGFGFVTFSSQDDLDAAISAFNNSMLEGQMIRVNKA